MEKLNFKHIEKVQHLKEIKKVYKNYQEIQNIRKNQYLEKTLLIDIVF